ncbi:MAG TPA: nitronate monooxygenase [Acidobacteriota bacterium]|nr:nitronate monooxygenase [Acidobacteriota bacterium]
MSQLDGLWRRGRDFLGSEVPVIAGAMTWISDAPFVAAVSNAGAFGCLAGGNMEPAVLTDEICRTRDLTDRPFAVNLITIAPNYKAHLDVVVKNRVPIVVFAGSFPRKPEVQRAKENGAKVMAFAPTEALARHLIGSGVDALILEGSEAGGHIGYVSLGILIQQVLLKIDEVPIFVAGGIADGAYVAHLLLMGASGVQMGTYFVLTEECGVHPRFKEAFIKAQARDAVATPQIGSELKVVAVRALRNKGLESFLDLQVDLVGRRKRKEISHEEAQYAVESFWVGALRRAVKDGDVETGSLMAGQSVGLVDRVRPLREALSVLVADAEAELARVRERLATR